eukprot:1977300-Rhodomonas_salina.3
MVSLALVLLRCGSLLHLDVSHNAVHADGAKTLTEAMSEQGDLALRHFEIGCNRLEDAGAGSLAEGLADCCEMEELILEQNSIGEAGIAAVAAVLDRIPQLQLLDVSGNIFQARCVCVSRVCLCAAVCWRTL